MLLVHRVRSTDLDTLLTNEPVGQTTKIPFTTNVWTRTEDHIHVVLLGNREETIDVSNSIEVELSLARLMDVPGNISLNRI